MPGATVAILIVDDHEVVRMGLRTLLERRPGFMVIGEAGGGGGGGEGGAPMAPGGGESLLDPAVTEKVLERIRRLAHGESDELATLSPQERKILGLIADGK